MHHVFIFTAVKSSLRELTRAVSALKYDDDDDKANLVFDVINLFNPLVQFRLQFNFYYKTFYSSMKRYKCVWVSLTNEM